MIQYRYVMRDGEFGIEHLFDAAADSLPWHKHDKGFGHTVRLIKGKAHMEIGDQSVKITKREYVFDETRMHRITADKAGTIIFNRLYPTPPNSGALLEHEGDWRWES